MSIQVDYKKFPTRQHEDWRYFAMKKNQAEQYLNKGHVAHSASGENTAGNGNHSRTELTALFGHDVFRVQNDIFSELVQKHTTPQYVVIQEKPEPTKLIAVTKEKREILPKDIRILNPPGISGELTLHISAEAEQTLVSVEIRVFLAENANLKLNIIAGASPENFAIIRIRAKLAEGAKLLFSNLQVPEGNIRSECHFNLSGPGADLKLHQAIIADGTAVNDTVLKAIHSAPETGSEMQTMTYGAGKSRNSLNGLIHVQTGSENVNAYQQARNFILSPESLSVGYPQLEIENQNVSCSHGTTMHAFDENQLFYLNTRGIPTEKAKRMILKGNLDYFFRRMNEPQKKQFLKKSYAIIDRLSI